MDLGLEDLWQLRVRQYTITSEPLAGMGQSPGEGLGDVEEAVDGTMFCNVQTHLYLWQVWDKAQEEGLEDEEEAVDDIGFASILLSPYLWQV